MLRTLAGASIGVCLACVASFSSARRATDGSRREVHLRSDVEHLMIKDAEADAEKGTLKILVRNETEYKIALLRGIVCLGSEPGTDPDNPRDGCEDIYFGRKFLLGSETWSEPSQVKFSIWNSRPINIRVLKIQTVDDD